MTKNIMIRPFEEELPSKFAERLGLEYSSTVDGRHKKDLGQFFTPSDIAGFMADLYELEVIKPKFRILDPGCGIGILSITLIEKLVMESDAIEIIDLVVFEIDTNIIDFTEASLNYLRVWLFERGIELKFFLCKNDFILHNTPILNNHSSEERYDIIISNPPYFKLPKNDERSKAARLVIYGQSNIYTIFLIIAAKLLADDGKMIFITPRSFCSGNYSRLFREVFFSLVDINLLHVFNSRKEAFKEDNVLQENVILLASKKQRTDDEKVTYDMSEESIDILISHSNGISDLKERVIDKYKFSDLVNLNSYQKIVHLPLSKTDSDIIKIFKSWTNSLNSLGFEISTGPVVDFRSEEFIKKDFDKGVVPLIWFHNIEMMNLIWPKNEGYKGKFKGQYIAKDEKSISRLLKNKNYIFLKRFSTKDDRRRLIAAPFISKYFKYDMIGVENHLNYIYALNSDLKEEEIFGLSALLNSKLFDLYFRTFNGNINVSATELRDFPLPDLIKIKLIGRKILKAKKNNSTFDIDELVDDIFKVKIDISSYS